VAEVRLDLAVRHENFPVALRLLPAGLRQDLRAVYDVARTIDDLGDEVAGDRLARLDAFEAELRTTWAGRPTGLAVLRRLAPTVRDHALTIEPFLALVHANRLDQKHSSYATWADLRRYCSYSADPVGRIVLEILGSATDDRLARSADICTALQLLEHCQDVGEDRRRGRTYLPVADLQIYGVGLPDLDAPTAGPRLRKVIAHEVVRAERLLGSGRPLVRSLRGGGRIAVAGYVAGGLATADALRRAGFDVLGARPAPARRDVARHAARLLGGRR
jgi:squalene synthase HpnC